MTSAMKSRTPTHTRHAFLLALALLMVLSACRTESQDESVATRQSEPFPADGTIAVYFHSTQRCPSCLKIENYSHEAIQDAFADELANGTLLWRMVNTDEPQNEHFITDFELYTKSLVLVQMREGKQVRWKNCKDVWELLNDKEAFQIYVQEEVRAFLDPS